MEVIWKWNKHQNITDSIINYTTLIKMILKKPLKNLNKNGFKKNF